MRVTNLNTVSFLMFLFLGLLSFTAIAQPTARLLGFTTHASLKKDANFKIEPMDGYLRQKLQDNPKITLVSNEAVATALTDLALEQAGAQVFLTSPQEKLNQLAGGSRYLLFGEAMASPTMMSPTGVISYNIYILDTETRLVGTSAVNVSNFALMPPKDAQGNAISPGMAKQPESAVRIASSIGKYLSEDPTRWPLRFKIEQTENLIEDKKQGKKLFWIGSAMAVGVTALGYLMDFGFLKMAGAVGPGTAGAIGLADWVRYNDAVKEKERLEKLWQAEFNEKYQ
jgi:hypothetical protein